jgi:hypothetical protein
VNQPGDPITDLSNSSAAPDVIAGAAGVNGTYNRDLFSDEASRLILKHGEKNIIKFRSSCFSFFIFGALCQIAPPPLKRASPPSATTPLRV